MNVGRFCFVFYPLLKNIYQYIQRQRAISLGKDSKKILEDVLKNLNSGLADSCRKESNSTFLLTFFIEPLRQEHGGGVEKMYAALTLMGERIKAREVDVVAEDKASFHRFVMGIHASGVLGSAPARASLVAKAFEREFLKRMLHSAVVGSVPMFAYMFLCFLKHPLPWVAAAKASKSGVLLWTSVAAFSVLSIKACVMGLWKRDSKQARTDYQIFLKRLSLEESPHKSMFYWTWFLPMWRANDRDVLKIEGRFMERAAEIVTCYKGASTVAS